MDVGSSSVEGISVSLKRFLVLMGLIAVVSACSSLMKYEKAEELKKNDEFDQAVKIEKPAEVPTDGSVAAPVVAPTPIPAATPAAKSKKEKATKASTKKNGKAAAVVVAPEAPAKRQPELEDSVGFNGRRPINDPFRAGEEVIHDVHYFKVSAGELKLKVEPYSMVNNRKSYTYAIEIKTVGLFSNFYAVDDRVETFVDFDEMIPRVFQLHVKESGQLREAKMLFDNQKNLATFWEKKVTKEDGEKEKKMQWDILPYSQNVYSAVFYMRNFQWDIGKEYSYRVANDEENLVFSGKALRREVLQTKLGPMKAIVVQPNIILKGKFKSIGENLIWLSDDDRKYILRIEAKIKIGTLISEVVKIIPGK
jgi:hypothetical protein